MNLFSTFDGGKTGIFSFNLRQNARINYPPTTIVISDLSLMKLATKRRSEKVMEHNDIERRPMLAVSWLHTECRPLCCALLILLSGIFAAETTLGQEESIDGGIELVADDSPPTNFTEDTSGLTPEQRMVLRSIRETDPILPIPMVRAAESLFDLQLYRDVRFLLGRIDKVELSDEQWLDVVDKTGSIFFLEVYNHPNTQPEGNRVAKKILSAARRATRKPARINRLITNLSSTDRSAARASLQQLETLGEAAVAQMIDTFVGGKSEAEQSIIRQALTYLGQASPEPLIGAARAKNANIKMEAIRALSQIDAPSSTEVMMWSSLAPNHPAELKQIARNALRQRGIDPDPKLIEQEFFTRSYRYLRGKLEAVTPMGGRVNIWSWNPESKKMIRRTVDPQTATQLVAARHAVSLYDINPGSIRNRAMFVLTQLESAQRMAGPGKPIDVNQVVRRLNTNAQEINTLLGQAVRLHLYPAAVACCQILKEKPSVQLLLGRDGKPSPLVQAITSGDRYLQAAALDTIQTIDPKVGFVGSSFVLELAVNLAVSGSQPVALLAHPDTQVGRTYAARANYERLVGVATNSGPSLFELATRSASVEVILISDEISFPSYRSLIRQLRSDWRTREIPIGLLYSDVDRGQQLVREMEADPLFAAMPFSTSQKMIQTHLARMLTRVQPYRVSTYDRQQHAKLAVDWLAKIANQRKEYRFYNLNRHETALYGLIFKPGFEAKASNILASLGTPSAQRQLVDYASQNAISAESRKQAVDALSASLKSRGNLLSAAEIQRQYDRYNASENQPKETQEILGSILDAFESNPSR